MTNPRNVKAFDGNGKLVTYSVYHDAQRGDTATAPDGTKGYLAVDATIKALCFVPFMK